MDKVTRPIHNTPSRSVRKERSHGVIKFAPPSVEGQQRLVFEDEPEHAEAQDE